MNRCFRIFVLAVFSIFLLNSSVARVDAEETGNKFGSFSANVSLVSEYRYRGLDQSGEEAALQGGFDWSHDSGFYLGTWASNVDFNDNDSTLEVDFYGGYATEIKGVSLDLSMIGYTYPGALKSSNYDFFEYTLGIGYETDSASFSGSVSYSSDFFGDSGDATYIQGGFDYELPIGLIVSHHVGKQWVDENTTYGAPDYTDWSIGVSYTLLGIDLSLIYIDTDIGETFDGTEQVGRDETLVFGVSRSF